MDRKPSLSVGRRKMSWTKKKIFVLADFCTCVRFSLSLFSPLSSLTLFLSLIIVRRSRRNPVQVTLYAH